MAVSLAFAAVTVGLVVSASVVLTAPAVAAAFGAGAATAVAATLVRRARVESPETGGLAGSHSTHR